LQNHNKIRVKYPITSNLDEIYSLFRIIKLKNEEFEITKTHTLKNRFKASEFKIKS
jgi:hypothetical protein